jgi:uncharacterized membrane protein YfcA
MHELILFLVGIIVGVMNSIAGGGMLIGFPVMLALGLPALSANVTANVVVLPGNMSSAFGYRRLLKKVPPIYLILLIPAALGAALGATILRHTSSAHFEHIIPLLIIFAVALFAFQPFLFAQLHKHLHGTKRMRNNLKPVLIVAVALFPLAIYGGYFGAGFGFVMLAFLGFTSLREHINRMNALKNLITVCIASISILILYSSHLINWHYGLFMGAGNLIGGYSGSGGAQKVSAQKLRIVVIIIGVCTATYLGLRSYS